MRRINTIMVYLRELFLQLLPPANEVAVRSCFLSCWSVSLSTNGVPCDHYLDLFKLVSLGTPYVDPQPRHLWTCPNLFTRTLSCSSGPPTLILQRPPPAWPRPTDIFKLVHLDLTTHHTGTPTPPFESRRLAFAWKVFLYSSITCLSKYVSTFIIFDYNDFWPCDANCGFVHSHKQELKDSFEFFTKTQYWKNWHQRLYYLKTKKNPVSCTTKGIFKLLYIHHLIFGLSWFSSNQ